MIKMRQICDVIPVEATLFTSTEGIEKPALHRFVSFSCFRRIGGLWAFAPGREDMDLGCDKYADANEQERALFTKYDGGFRSV